MYNVAGRGQTTTRQIRMTLPYIRVDTPVVVVFRALGRSSYVDLRGGCETERAGFVADRDILEHIVYDLADGDMIRTLQSSLDEAFVVQNQTVALDFIGRRGSAVNLGRPKRVKYARDLLRKEFLPHVGVDDRSDTKKAFFVGYMVHKLLMCSLERVDEDDRDHYGKKRLDLAGPLLTVLFRTLLKKLTSDVQLYLQKCLDEGRDFNLSYVQCP